MKIHKQIEKDRNIDNLNSLIYDLQFVKRMSEDKRHFWERKLCSSFFNLISQESTYPFLKVKKKEFLINKKMEMEKGILEIIRKNNFSEALVVSLVPFGNFEHKKYLLNLMRTNRK